MKTKNFILIGALCTCLLYCSKERLLDDNGNPQASTLKTLTVKVEDGSVLNSKIDEVRVITNVYSCAKCSEMLAPILLAEGNFTNGGFMITLPTSSEIHSITDGIQNMMNSNEWRYDRFYVPEDVNVNNPYANSQTVAITIVASKSGEDFGIFTYENRNKNIEGVLIYADSDITLNGTSSEMTYTEDGITYYYEYNISLKKGWNFVYAILTSSAMSKTANVLITTTPQSGMKWYFSENYF